MFQLTEQEFGRLKSKIVSSSWGGLRRAYPYAFTEQGVAMLSSVLKRNRAIQVNIAIMRAFVRLRKMISSNKSNKALARRLSELQKNYDAQFRVVFDAIRELMREPDPKSRHIASVSRCADECRLPPDASRLRTMPRGARLSHDHSPCARRVQALARGECL